MSGSLSQVTKGFFQVPMGNVTNISNFTFLNPKVLGNSLTSALQLFLSVFPTRPGLLSDNHTNLFTFAPRLSPYWYTELHVINIKYPRKTATSSDFTTLISSLLSQAQLSTLFPAFLNSSMVPRPTDSISAMFHDSVPYINDHNHYVSNRLC